MILRLPDDYDDFACLGAACRNSCCVGWELDIDEDTADYYRTVEGPFGERLRACIGLDALPDGEESEVFEKQVNGRCPFLNDQNLCDIVLTLGEEALCDVCAEYPRYTVTYGDVVEKTLTLSCEEAARLFAERTEPLMFAEYDYPDELVPEEKPGGESPVLSQAEFEARRFDALRLFYRTDLDLAEKTGRFLAMFRDASEPGGPAGIAKDAEIRGTSGIPCREERDGAHLRGDLIGRLEVLDPSMADQWLRIRELAKDGTAEALRSAYPPDPLLYENLLIYFWFRYAPRAMADGDLRGKANFAVLCAAMIRDLELLRISEKASEAGAAALTRGEFIRLISAFSREIEHSEDNLTALIASCGTLSDAQIRTTAAELCGSPVPGTAAELCGRGSDS